MRVEELSTKSFEILYDVDEQYNNELLSTREPLINIPDAYCDILAEFKSRLPSMVMLASVLLLSIMHCDSHPAHTHETEQLKTQKVLQLSCE